MTVKTLFPRIAHPWICEA